MFAVEHFLRHKIWAPPERVRKKKDDNCDVHVKTIGGDVVHLRLFSSNSTATLENYEARDKPVTLYFHGNSEDLESCGSYLTWLATNMEQNVLGVEYVGYGKSSRNRETTEKNMCETADAALDYVCSTLGHKLHRVLVIGRSLGSVPAVHVASKRMNAGLGGLVLISALASGARCVMPSEYIPNAVMTSLDTVFGANILKMKDIQCMILIVHGDKDSVVELKNAQALYQRCNGWCAPRLYVVKGGGHNDLSDRHGKEVLRQLIDFNLACLETARLRSCQEESKTPYELLVEF
ncbi:MAG: alpha/beta hydrolase [Proteobacteria bacterium]|jgi:pimeloyl-ACP methyl ester carboxylesterase|nr:alpha/beta hydrolase [Pseudomonadota bacterium]